MAILSSPLLSLQLSYFGEVFYLRQELIHPPPSTHSSHQLYHDGIVTKPGILVFLQKSEFCILQYFSAIFAVLPVLLEAI